MKERRIVRISAAMLGKDGNPPWGEDLGTVDVIMDGDWSKLKLIGVDSLVQLAGGSTVVTLRFGPKDAAAN